ncbi:unnamed protein product [Trichobilharzia szidati]|nr:unnamed protein product [Trichobilharzia szidati]
MILSNKVAPATFDHLASGGIRIIYNQQDKTFAQHAIINNHGSIHQEDIKVFCTQAQGGYPQQTILNERKGGKDYGKYFKCSSCDRTFTSRSGLWYHVQLVHEVQNYPCDHCSRSFRLKQYLIAHVQQVHEKRLAKCEECGATFASLGNLKKHEKSIHGGRLFDCPSCDRSFTSRSGLWYHIHLVHDVQSFQCDVCSRTFALRVYLHAHVQQVHGKRMVKCEQCGNFFLSGSTFRRHVETQHKGVKLPPSNNYNSPVDRKPSGLRPPVGEVIFKCASCNKSFASRSDVAVHYRHVHALKYIKCAECDRTFTSKSSLQSHVRVAHPDDDEEEEAEEEMVDMPLPSKKSPVKTVTILLFRTNKNLRLQNPPVS